MNPQNPRHLIRAIETAGQASERKPLRANTLILGLAPDRAELKERIVSRLDGMIAAGLEQEVRGLAAKYGWEVSPMRTIGYQEWQDYFAGVHGLDETKQLIIKNTLSYAKRQRTWFKRNNSVHWLSNRDKLTESVDFTTTLLNT
jgi:tRNA dimethylallyltransferase